MVWNKLDFGHVGRRISQLQKKLQNLESSPMASSGDMQAANQDLNTWLDTEEITWKQHSRNTWLKLGDKNKSFFHNKASNRKAQNSILGLNDHNGVWQEDPWIIEAMATNYFSTLFTSSNPSNWEELNEAMEPVISESMNYLLIREFQALEVAQTLK